MSVLQRLLLLWTQCALLQYNTFNSFMADHDIRISKRWFVGVLVKGGKKPLPFHVYFLNSFPCMYGVVSRCDFFHKDLIYKPLTLIQSIISWHSRSKPLFEPMYDNRWHNTIPDSWGGNGDVWTVILWNHGLHIQFGGNGWLLPEVKMHFHHMLFTICGRNVFTKGRMAAPITKV